MLPDEWEIVDGVYRPNDDSHLLASVIEEQDLEGKTFLDVGTGSGILAYVAAEHGADVAAVDINPEAVRTARENLSRHGYTAEVVRSDLFENVSGLFDVIVCNPPYIPVDPELGTMEERAWSGGEHGREMIDRFIANVPRYLSEAGEVFLLQLEQNGVDVTKEMFLRHGMAVDVVAAKKLPWERLIVLHAAYNQ